MERKRSAFSWLAMDVRSSSEMRTSESRVRTVRQARTCGSAAATRRAISSVASFSWRPPGPIAPVSVPPWPGIDRDRQRRNGRRRGAPAGRRRGRRGGPPSDLDDDPVGRGQGIGARGQVRLAEVHGRRVAREADGRRRADRRISSRGTADRSASRRTGPGRTCRRRSSSSSRPPTAAARPGSSGRRARRRPRSRAAADRPATASRRVWRRPTCPRRRPAGRGSSRRSRRARRATPEPGAPARRSGRRGGPPGPAPCRARAGSGGPGPVSVRTLVPGSEATVKPSARAASDTTNSLPPIVPTGCVSPFQRIVARSSARRTGGGEREGGSGPRRRRCGGSSTGSGRLFRCEVLSLERVARPAPQDRGLARGDVDLVVALRLDRRTRGPRSRNRRGRACGEPRTPVDARTRPGLRSATATPSRNARE